MAEQAHKRIRPALFCSLGVVVVLTAGEAHSAREQSTSAYVAASPAYETGLAGPLIELRFTLTASGGASEVAAVRLMQRRGSITQSFLVPGGHPYVSEGYLLDRTANGWKGRIILSKLARGGPARGMGTPRGSRFLDVELRRQGETLTATCSSGGAHVPVTARFVTWDEIAGRNDPLDASKSWPAWYGPGCNFAAQPSGHRLVDDPAEARLLWKSQERFGSGKAQSPRYGVIAEDSGRLPLLPGSGGGPARWWPAAACTSTT